MFVLPSKAYEDFKNDTLRQIIATEKIVPPYAISFLFQMKGKLDTDIDNMVTSFMDVLQEKGILKDDKLVMEIHASKVGGRPDWITKIEIVHYEPDANE